MKGLSALYLIFWLGVTGCGGIGYGLHGRGSTATARPRGSVTVYVSNDHAEDVRVLLLRGSTLIPIGSVGSFAARRFLIPPAQVGTNGTLQLVAQALGSRAQAVPEALDIEPGVEVEFHIENNLKFSQLVRRVYRPQ